MAQKMRIRQLETTETVKKEMSRSAAFRRDLRAAVLRFISSDWGECFQGDMEYNDQALEAGEDQIIGVYDTSAGRVWVLADPATFDTKVLFQFEY